MKQLDSVRMSVLKATDLVSMKHAGGTKDYQTERGTDFQKSIDSQFFSRPSGGFNKAQFGSFSSTMNSSRAQTHGKNLSGAMGKVGLNGSGNKFIMKQC